MTVSDLCMTVSDLCTSATLKRRLSVHTASEHCHWLAARTHSDGYLQRLSIEQEVTDTPGVLGKACQTAVCTEQAAQTYTTQHALSNFAGHMHRSTC